MDDVRNLEPELRALRLEVRDLHSQLRAVMTGLAAVGALVLLVLAGLSLWAGSYREVSDSGDEIEDPDMISLAGLPAQASDAENGAVQVFAVLTIVALVVVVVAVLATLAGLSTVPSTIAVAVLFIVWMGLRIVVSAAGGRGTIGDLGAEAAGGAWWPAAAAVWAAGGTWLVHHVRS